MIRGRRNVNQEGDFSLFSKSISLSPLPFLSMIIEFKASVAFITPFAPKPGNPSIRTTLGLKLDCSSIKFPVCLFTLSAIIPKFCGTKAHLNKKQNSSRGSSTKKPHTVVKGLGERIAWRTVIRADSSRMAGKKSVIDLKRVVVLEALNHLSRRVFDGERMEMREVERWCFTTSSLA